MLLPTHAMLFRNFNFDVNVFKWVRCVHTYLPYYNIGTLHIPKVCHHEHANYTDFTQLINDFAIFFLYYYDKKHTHKHDVQVINIILWTVCIVWLCTRI